jgi:hypothetical protein
MDYWANSKTQSFSADRQSQFAKRKKAERPKEVNYGLFVFYVMSFTRFPRNSLSGYPLSFGFQKRPFFNIFHKIHVINIDESATHAIINVTKI